MNRGNILFVIIVAVINAGCRTNSTNSTGDDSIMLCNQVLHQIALSYYESCFTPDMNHEKIMNEYFSGKIDSGEYSQRVDSLIEVRKRITPKCVLEYYDEIGIIFKNNKLNEDMVNSIKISLEDRYVKENFKDVDIQNILDSVASTSKLDASKLAVGYLQILPHIKQDRYPWGHGMGSDWLVKNIL
jgi:hypothetical protein